MPVKEVTEQGATRRMRPSDFYEPGRKNFDPKVPAKERRVVRPTRSPRPGQGKPGSPDYKPRRPRNPPKVFPDDYPVPKNAPKGGLSRVPLPSRAPAFGRALGRALPAGRFLDAYQAGQALGYGVSTLLQTYKLRQRRIAIHRTHYLYMKCPLPITGGPYRNQAVTCGHVNYFSNETNLNNSLGTDFSPHIGKHNVFFVNVVSPSGGWYAAKKLAEFWKPRGGTYVNWDAVPLSPMFVAGMPDVPWIGEGLNPNTMRQLVTVLEPSLAPEPVADPALDPATDRRGRTITDTKDRPVRPSRPRLRVPPRKREKEGKPGTRAKRLMVWFFHALDVTSEFAEIVDAFYEALPKETKDKWKCNRSDFGIDVAGQYGIDNADCKAKALWHNWHKLDFTKAVENVIKNAIQDEMLGFIQRVIPRNSGSAFDDALRQFNEDMEVILDEGVDLRRYMNPWKGKFDYGLPPL